MLKQNIENKIVEWVGEGYKLTHEECRECTREMCETCDTKWTYNKALTDLRSKAPLLAQSIVEEIRKEIPQLYQIEFTDNRFMEGYDKGWKDYKNKLLTSLEVKEDK